MPTRITRNDVPPLHGDDLEDFWSTEQTGTGSPQNVAHGLGRVPRRVMAIISEDPAGSGFDVAYGSHTPTNAVVTVTSGVKFNIYAI